MGWMLFVIPTLWFLFAVFACDSLFHAKLAKDAKEETSHSLGIARD
jgi:hypothetical protein